MLQMFQKSYCNLFKNTNNSLHIFDYLCTSLYHITKLKYSTIYALSSGHGKCGVAVIRISGNNAGQSILKMTSSKYLPPPRKAVLRNIIHPYSREVLDKGLVLWFPSPKSFTGEDSVEFHIHGGPAVCKAVLSGLGKLPNFTPAEPGDFTKRAFYNSKLDLTSVEGLGDLIHAETEAQRKQALRQMEGALREIYTEWRELILRSRANIEAYIDFSEDDNIEQGVLMTVRQNLEKLVTEMSKHITDSRRGERINSGLNLVILGKPNVGKSSFLNAVVRRPAAIVSPIAGTTRDVVAVSLDLGGYPVNISDTAGLRSTEDIVEKEGISRALREVERADIALIIVDAVDLFASLTGAGAVKRFDLECFLEKYFREVGILSDHVRSSEISSTDKYEWLANKNYVVFVNKVDLLTSETKVKLSEEFKHCSNICLTSLKTFEGLDDALQEMKNLCVDMCGSGSLAETPYLTSQRQKTHIEQCLKHIQSILGISNEPRTSFSENAEDSSGDDDITDVDLLSREETLVIAAQILRFASNELGCVTGQITTEDVLDHIFSSFCIGK